MIPANLWLPRGQKVKIKVNKPYLKDKMGVIDQFYWVTGEYLVWLEGGKSGLPIPLAPSEIEKVP